VNKKLWAVSSFTPTPIMEANAFRPFSQNSRSPTVAREFQIGLYDPVEADLEHFWDGCSTGFLGERLYVWN